MMLQLTNDVIAGHLLQTYWIGYISCQLLLVFSTDHFRRPKALTGSSVC